ncbi:hypothetical protein [Cryptosporangium minutisporangium]|uniref:Uncharacterized protein n=1 Tax=Cryptosporangium minutisporangium TaxID=113569 RepID=A0ABP6TBZ8_9ACTN
METVGFTTVGWTDTGQGWRQERESTENVPDQYWAVANDQLQLVPQPPESLQDLTGIPIWSLSSVPIGSADHWCFTVQGRGLGHRAGTVQFAFAHGRHPASVVWRAAAALVTSADRGSADRMPWSRSEVSVPAVASAVTGDAEFEKATAELLTALLGSAGMTIVPAGPELMANVLPAVLAVVPTKVSRALRWHTCLLQPAKSVRAAQNAVVGEWSPPMRRLAGSAAAEVDLWLDNMRGQRRRLERGADTGDLVTLVARGLAQGYVADPEETANAESVRTALERTYAAWQRPALDVPRLVSEGHTAKLLAAPDTVRQYAASAPHAAAGLIRGGSATLETGVAVLLFQGLLGHLQTDDAVADALGLPSDDRSPSDGYLAWLGSIVNQSLDHEQNWALIQAFTARYGRWSSQAARIACAPLFKAMGYQPADHPDLYPFDAAGIAARIRQRDAVGDDVRRQIETSVDPLGAVRAVTEQLDVRSARLFGGLLACALAVSERPAEWDERLYALVTGWVNEQAADAAAHRQIEGPTPPQWWARMASYAARTTRDRARAASDRTIVVDAGLECLLQHGYDERDVLVAVSDTQSTTLEAHLRDLGSLPRLTRTTADLVGQVLPLWQDEHRELTSARQELASARQELTTTRQQLAAAQRGAQSAGARTRDASRPDASRSDGSRPDASRPDASDADVEPGSDRRVAHRTRSRLAAFFAPVLRKRDAGPGGDAGPPGPAGIAAVLGVLVLIVAVVVAVVWMAVGGSDDEPRTPTASRSGTTQGSAQSPTAPDFWATNSSYGGTQQVSCGFKTATAPAPSVRAVLVRYDTRGIAVEATTKLVDAGPSGTYAVEHAFAAPLRGSYVTVYVLVDKGPTSDFAAMTIAEERSKEDGAAVLDAAEKLDAQPVLMLS